MIAANPESAMHKFEQLGKAYMRKYEEQFLAVESAPVFKDRQFNLYDAYTLGQQFENWNMYSQYLSKNESATAAQLGTLPTLAIDIIAAAYGASVAPFLASIQTLEDEQGLVYFKNVISQTTRGGITKGETLVDAKKGFQADESNFGSELIKDEVLGTTTAATTQTFTSAKKPIRKNAPSSIKIVDLGGAGIDWTGTFDINGNLLSPQMMTGSINFDTGAISLTFSAAPATGKTIKLTYREDFEQTDVPEVQSALTTDFVRTDVWALKQLTSAFKSFQMQKRFGVMADEDAINDLVGLFADIESRNVIGALKDLATAQSAVNGAITFDATVPTGVAEVDHRQSFKYKLGLADSYINRAAGRGSANRLVAGHKACEYIRALDGFTPVQTGVGLGAHLFGYLDGLPVIRAWYVDTASVIASYLNPTTPWEAPVVLGTYMPIFVTDVMGTGSNPLQTQRAIATQKVAQGVVSQFTQLITISNLP